MSYIILSGGVIIWPIILLSIISLAIVLEKTWNLARDIIIPKNLTEHLISLVADDSLTEKKIRKMSKDSVLGSIFAKLINEKNNDKANLRLKAEEVGRFEVNRLEQYLSLLGTIATVSPILGLLGTVMGMINIFSNLLEANLSSVSPLASGIAEALVTTAAGLVVAIPTLIFYRHFTRIIENYALELEEESNKLIDYLSK
ncbi:MotA/TolQ/ExbB proton channel family protein [SAR86 cluster bacterium]|jgi:biopolymer transport protein ExbB|nr:MotA/TolQ/ExbB proton channel family protein [SAR86 cluster bacterium]|tara:strand:- start:6 stop:605 length:600 start_codon:yes stop_codon:yes gene_type:complete